LKVLQMVLGGVILGALVAPSGRGQATGQVASSSKPAVIERTVPMGDYRFHYKDQGTGGPTVVMEAGLCQAMETWGGVVADVAVFTRVFTYDRAGLGSSSRILPQGGKRSARPQELRTSRQIVEELRDLLRKAGLPAPYVLVGHSFGGLNVRLFASQYPNEVAGIVLVDSSSEEEYSRYAALLPPGQQGGYRHVNQGGNCERVDLLASAGQLREAAPLPHVPLTIITPAPKDASKETSQAHLELQADLARRAPNSVHLFAERSGHFIQSDRPDVVIEAIRRVVEQARPYPIPLPTEDDLKQTRILHLSIPGEAMISGATLALSGFAGWRWRKRKRKANSEMNRAQRRQASRKERGTRGQGDKETRRQG